MVFFLIIFQSNCQRTNQHGCGNEWNNCEIVLQYMCSDNIRDGTTTNTIPDQPSNCLNNDCNRDIRFGMHEDYGEVFFFLYVFCNHFCFKVLVAFSTSR